jgi:hypothetical protein
VSVQPIFIFSLPRSGSTLLQRVLAAHPHIATASEPWILLPFVYATRRQGIYTDYEQRLSVGALEDFFKAMPGGKSAYLTELKAFCLELYDRASPEGSHYFLDKTPRYHLIVDEIIQTFPEAKFIFLWRNPLAVAGSLLETFAHSKWNLHYYKVDLYKGLDNLIRAAARYKDQAFTVRYEDFVQQPDHHARAIFKYLDIDYETTILQKFSQVNLEGKRGDPTGVKKYKSISSASLDKWRTTLANPLRKQWAKQYLVWIGRKRLDAMGYSLTELQRELASVSPTSRHLLSDCAQMSYGIFRNIVEPRILMNKLKQLPEWSKANTVG